MQPADPATAFIIIQILNYLLTAVLLVHTWRHERPLFYLIPAAILFGFIVEYSQVVKSPPPYYYTESLVWLPGPVPLSIILSWGTIIYAALRTARALALPATLVPIAAGLLATVIDLVCDPAFVSLGVWVWAEPGAWFGIPWDNYVGWFVIGASYTAMLELAGRVGHGKAWWTAAAPFLAIVPAFLIFVAVMLGYLWLVGRHFVDEATIVALFFGTWVTLLLARLGRMRGDVPVDGWRLAPPAFVFAVSLAILFLTPLHAKQPELALVIPAFALLGMAGYLWPSRQVLGLARAGGTGAAHTRRRYLVWAFLAGLLPALGLAAFAPHRGLIGAIELPGDDVFLPDEKVQWWYWTGHLESEEGRRFGFEVVFFTFDSFLVMRDQLTQVAITDVDGDKFHFAEHLKFHLPARTTDRFALTAGPGDIIRATGDANGDRLRSEVGGYVLDLELAPTKAPVLHYGGDAHPYRYGGYTYYYSRVRMETRGTITVGGKTYKVSGASWFDRQYGELYQAIVKGWQWFAIDLADNRQIMLYDILGKSNAGERTGSVTDAGGNTRTLSGHQFQVEILGHWTSPHTGCTYPSGWRVTVEGESFEVQPMVKDQELRARHGYWAGPEYWEGASSVTGAVPGKAYVELNGYCRGVEGSLDL
ncbi:carotenoid biosynthesis protein [Aromatoleum anaerobium]|uniref:Carotenoid biosynthesis protein n=3 Tax=Aromatoleum TaxID=551759 RepID=A0ABX1PJ62_9RHOO|nr:carotenoid biosynthesis protein [Aromatoleum anaerobium]MCK0506629.1 carotenoid biosynthesis protein [Aromatoleum anaerobium]